MRTAAEPFTSDSAYVGALASAGGQAIETLQRPGDRGALVVGLYASPPYDLHVPPLAVDRLSINLSPSRVVGGLDGDRPRAYPARRHSLFLTPAGAGAHWRKDAPSRHINIYFHAHSLQDPDADCSGFNPGTVPLLNGGLRGGRGLLDALAAELSGTGHTEPFAAEAVDCLARLILVQLARRQCQDLARANPLSATLLARLRDYVQAQLDQRLLVADLAHVAGLPPNRFAQAFVAATGSSPHQFVLGQRLHRAQALLLQSGQSLADIAAACGFASQQHMTRLMRQRLGTTPARYRAQDSV